MFVPRGAEEDPEGVIGAYDVENKFLGLWDCTSADSDYPLQRRDQAKFQLSTDIQSRAVAQTINWLLINLKPDDRRSERNGNLRKGKLYVLLRESRDF